jgi:ATP adenylyltransferase
MEYIENHGKEGSCVFCRAAALEDSPENLIVHRGQQAFVILNRYPYTSGHVMIVPFRHEPALDTLEAADRAEMMELTSLDDRAARRVSNGLQRGHEHR